MKFIKMGKTKFAIQCLSAPRNSRRASVATVEEDLPVCMYPWPVNSGERRDQGRRIVGLLDCRRLGSGHQVIEMGEIHSMGYRLLPAAVFPLSGIPAISSETALRSAFDGVDLKKERCLTSYYMLSCRGNCAGGAHHRGPESPASSGPP